jgi:predicted nucleotidyltransferase
VVVKEELLERLREATARVFRDRPVIAAYAYGSRISGRPREGSDLDVGCYLEGYREGRRLSLRDELILASRLSDAVGVDVDLRDLTDAPLELRGRVLEDGVRIYSGDEPQRVGLERDLLARYHDYKDIFREMHAIRLRRLAGPGP